MGVEVSKVPGGLHVDGLLLKNGKCGCTSFAACCYTWSKVKKKGDEVNFTAKAATPDTNDNYTWGYTVTKDGMIVNVSIDDARDKVTYSGFLPPAASEWQDKGWTLVEKIGEREDKAVFRCGMSKWLYKEKDQGTLFISLPDNWKCPMCGSPTSGFEQIG
ncbi:hypothetical protein LCGC14_1906530 [marine sediment metagenome]|uniref:Rubredoxin-like domain-containing protein n=1 Tax=marine sediment metagenome TaxID=412755 RepID=A0A0F9FVF3_9ZZZZ